MVLALESPLLPAGARIVPGADLDNLKRLEDAFGGRFTDSSFSDLVEANVAAARVTGYMNSRTQAEEEAVDARIREIEAATGEKLENYMRSPRLRREAVSPVGIARGAGEVGRLPWRDVPTADERERMLAFERSAGRFDWQGFHRDQFEQRLKQLAEQHPDKLAVIRPHVGILEDTRQLTQAAEERLRDVTARSGWGTWLAGTAWGGLKGSMYDPTFVPAMIVGGVWGISRNLAKAALVNGAVNAGANVVQQPWVQSWRREAGLDYGLGHAAGDVAGAFATGAALDAGVRGLWRGGRLGVARARGQETGSLAEHLIGGRPVDDAFGMHSRLTAEETMSQARADAQRDLAEMRDAAAAETGAKSELPAAMRDASRDAGRLDRAVEALPEDHPARRAMTGDDAELVRLARESGADADPAVRGALAEIEADQPWKADIERAKQQFGLSDADAGLVHEQLARAIRAVEDGEPVPAPSRDLPSARPASLADTHAGELDAMFSLRAGERGADGERIRAYHWTDQKFERFDNQFTSEAGFHFGSMEQAITRSGSKGFVPWPLRGRLLPVEIDAAKILDLPRDAGHWNGWAIANELLSQGIMTAAERDAARALPRQDATRHVREFLRDKGYDLVRYPNDYEGEGVSYMALGTGNVRHARSGAVLYAIPDHPVRLDAIAFAEPAGKEALAQVEALAKKWGVAVAGEAKLPAPPLVPDGQFPGIAGLYAAMQRNGLTVGRPYEADVPVAQVRALQPPTDIEAARVTRYVAEPPPRAVNVAEETSVTLHRYGDVYYTLDGHHRVEAARRRGDTAIAARVRDIEPKDAAALSDPVRRFVETLKGRKLAPQDEPHELGPGFRRVAPDLERAVLEGLEPRRRKLVPEGVRVALFEGGGDDLEGGFAGEHGLIAIAARALDKEAVLAHEAIHALKDFGHITPAEWGVLRAGASDWLRSEQAEQYRQAYAGRAGLDALLEEEAVAHLYEARVRDGADLGPRLNGLLDRLREAIERIGNFLRGNGYQSLEDVLARIDSGEVAARPGNREVAPGVTTGEPQTVPGSPEAARTELDAGLRSHEMRDLVDVCKG